ncbi:MAG: hypothetical protein AB1664_07630 [Thermodesulfobacteriota bacterium]
MTVQRMFVAVLMSLLVALCCGPLVAAEKSLSPALGAEKKRLAANEEAARLVGQWQIYMTKEPGKDYRDAYKGRPFVPVGPHSFILLMEYRPDGTFRRVSRIDGTETVDEGLWTLKGHELRQKRIGGQGEEVLYLRFDGTDQFTSIEVYEQTPDPGLFAQFRRLSQ